MGTWRCLEPLPHTVTSRRREVDVADVEAAQLGHPQPAAVEQLEHGVVPEPDRRRVAVHPGRRLVEQHVELAVAEDPRQAALARGRRQA